MIGSVQRTARGGQTRHPYRHAAAVAAAALVVGITAACTDSSHASGKTTATSSPAPTAGVPSNLRRFYDQRLDWTSCDNGFQCTKLTVPLNYAQPNGKTIQLSVIRKRATNLSQRIGSLLVNPGGPGGSGVDYVLGGDVVTPRIAARYDIVGFDPRGVDRSAPVSCLTNSQMDAYVALTPAPRTAAEVRQVVNESKFFGKRCEAESGSLLPYVGTPNAARDMDVLRGALGDPKLYYMGKSYGTYLGEVYASEFPRRVGRMVLDGVLDPNLTTEQLSLAQAVGFQQDLTLFINDCTKSPTCPLGSNPQAAQAKLASFLNGLQTHPLPTGTSRKLDQALALTGIAAAMYSQQSWPALREALAQAMAGNGAILLQFADSYNGRTNGHYSNMDEAEAAVDCLDHPQSLTVAQIQAAMPEYQKASPIFGPMLDWSNLGCAYWPVSSHSRPHTIRAAGAAPILLVGNTGDPATPYAWARSAASQMASAHLLTYNGAGHTAYNLGSSCIDDAVDAYLLHGTIPPAGTTCQPGSRTR